MSLGINNTASVSDLSQRHLTITGEAEPGQRFKGLGHRGYHQCRPARLYWHHQPAGRRDLALRDRHRHHRTPVLIGSGTSVASGGWNITADQALADGSYTITAIAASSSARRPSGTTTIARDLVIDTVGPNVTGATFDRKTGRIEVTFQDFGGLNNTGVGLDMASVVDAGNFQLVVAGPPAMRTVSVDRCFSHARDDRGDRVRHAQVKEERSLRRSLLSQDRFGTSRRPARHPG